MGRVKPTAMEITEDLAQEAHERGRTNGLGGKVPVTVNSNDILEEAGFGRWNWILLGLCYTSCVLASSNHLSIIYLAYSPDFFFVTDGENPEHFDNGCREAPEKDANQDTYFYDSSVFKTTVVTEWNLVCDNAVLLPTLTFTYMLGIGLSNLLAGALSDAFGRRVLVLTMATVHIVSSFVTWFSPSFWVFLIGRMFAGGSIHTAWAGLFILLQEVTPRQHRTLTSGIMNFGWSTGSMWICFLAYFIRDWRTLQLVFSLMSLLMIACFFFLPESPRWLLASGRFEEAKKTLKDIARKNGKDIDLRVFDNSIDVLQKDTCVDTKSSFFIEVKKMANIFVDLVRTPKMRRRTLLMMPTFFAVGMGNYGIHFSSRFASLDLFAVNMVKATTNFLVVVVFMFVLKYVDRTKCLLSMYSLTGIVAISFYLMPTGIRPIVFVFAQTLFAGDYYIVDTYVPELLPTPTINFGFNFLEFVSKIGSSIAPFIVDLGGAIDPGLPPLVFGCVLSVASISFFFLPETRGKPLPQTVAEVEEEVEVTISGCLINKMKK